MDPLKNTPSESAKAMGSSKVLSIATTSNRHDTNGTTHGSSSAAKLAEMPAGSHLLSHLRANPGFLFDMLGRVASRHLSSCADPSQNRLTILPSGCLVPHDRKRKNVSVGGRSYSLARVIGGIQWVYSTRRHGAESETAFDSMEASHLCHNPDCINGSHICLESQAANAARIACSKFGRAVKCPHRPSCMTAAGTPVPHITDLLRNGQAQVTHDSKSQPTKHALALKRAVIAACASTRRQSHHDSHHHGASPCVIYGPHQKSKLLQPPTSSMDLIDRCPRPILQASFETFFLGLGIASDLKEPKQSPVYGGAPSSKRCKRVSSSITNRDADSQLTLSHLCGNPYCFAVGHIIMEPMVVNQSRATCHFHRSKAHCFHSPPCILDTTGVCEQVTV